MKHLLSLAVSLLCLIGQSEVVCHCFETNSTRLVRKFHTYSAKTEALIPTPNYITDGITHWWDGQLNVGFGHHKDGDLAFWKDLIGDKDLLITSTDVTFDKLSFYCPFKKTGGYPQYRRRTAGMASTENNVQIPDSELVTIEVCAANYDNGVPYHVSSDQYDMLVCNGASSQDDPYFYSPFMLAFYNDYNPRNYNGDPYYIIVARGSDAGIRCQDFYANTYMHKFYNNWIFNLSYSNNNITERTANTGQGFYQPYYSSNLEYIEFNSTFASSNFVTNNAPPKYRNDGSSAGTTGYRPIPGYCFTIGGSRAYKYQYGYYWVEKNFWSGHIFCVRTYNRRLSYEEREHNARIDHERFYRHINH